MVFNELGVGCPSGGAADSVVACRVASPGFESQGCLNLFVYPPYSIWSTWDDT